MGRVSCRLLFITFWTRIYPYFSPDDSHEGVVGMGFWGGRAHFFLDMMVMALVVDIKGQHTVELLRFNKLSNRGTDGEMVIPSCKKKN